MIKKFSKFNEYNQSLIDGDDIILCVCDLLDEGFILVDDEDKYDDEHECIVLYNVHIYKPSLFGVVYYTADLSDKIYNIRKSNSSKEQRAIWELVKIASNKIKSISGLDYYARVDFSYYDTRIVFFTSL